MVEPTVTNATDRKPKRYEISVDGVQAGLAAYVDTATQRIFYHTETSDDFAGQGLASKLVAAALADTRASGKRIVAIDARTAVALYAGIATAMCASWLLLYDQVHRRRGQLVTAGIDQQAFGANRIRAVAGIAAYSTAGVIGALWLPATALVIFVAMPVFYALTTERIRPAASKGR